MITNVERKTTFFNQNCYKKQQNNLLIATPKYIPTHKSQQSTHNLTFVLNTLLLIATQKSILPRPPDASRPPAWGNKKMTLNPGEINCCFINVCKLWSWLITALAAQRTCNANQDQKHNIQTNHPPAISWGASSRPPCRPPRPRLHRDRRQSRRNDRLMR